MIHAAHVLEEVTSARSFVTAAGTVLTVSRVSLILESFDSIFVITARPRRP